MRGYPDRLCRLFPLVLVAAIGNAQAQAPLPAWRTQPVESVTVTAPKDAPDDVIKNFVETYAEPAPVAGKIVRWEEGICPVVVGLRSEAIHFIVARLKANAVKVGAPVDERPDCKPNIEIVFTTTPQALMDNVRKKNPGYLGYSHRTVTTDRLAIVTHPIQAWYTTAIGGDQTVVTDISSLADRGAGRRKILETAMTGGPADAESLATVDPPCGNTPRYPIDGCVSQFYHIIIAANPDKLVEYEIGGLADYISILALSKVATVDRCQKLTSIIHMLVPNCSAAADEMTLSDEAFLRGLYKSPAGYNLVAQKASMREAMKREFQKR